MKLHEQVLGSFKNTVEINHSQLNIHVLLNTYLILVYIEYAGKWKRLCSKALHGMNNTSESI